MTMYSSQVKSKYKKDCCEKYNTDVQSKNRGKIAKIYNKDV